MSQLKVPVSSKDHIKGPDDGALTLVEYGDFQCPFCAQAHSILQRLEEELGRDLRLVFRHFPLTQSHEYALLGAMSTESAGLQGKFWEMHDIIYDNQGLLSRDGVEEFARALELDEERFRQGLSNEDLANKIREDFLSGIRSGVNGTPSFFLNGEKYEGPLEGDLLRRRVEAA